MGTLGSIWSGFRIRFLYLLIANVVGVAFVAESYAADVVFRDLPEDLQLYPRDTQDSAAVVISGIVTATGYDSVIVEVYKESAQESGLWKRHSTGLEYEGNSASFSLSPRIHAELSEYSFHIYLDDELVAQRDSIVCGDAFLINGQSNSHPSSPLATYRNEFVRSFGVITGYNAYDPADTAWGIAVGEGAWTSNTDFGVGVWGLCLQQLIKETYGIPTCIIAGGSGGSTIEYNLRNDAHPLDLETTYGRQLYRTTKAGLSNHVKAILWHQGEANSDASWRLYASRFDTLYRAWKEDYPNVEKVYVFQIHPGCGGEYQGPLREVQRRFPESYRDVEIMSTVGLVAHDGCHYDYEGYKQMAAWIFRLVARDFYGSTDTLNIAPPNLQDAYFSTDAMDEIVLEFDQIVLWPADTLGASMKDYFYLDGVYGAVDTGYIAGEGHTVMLRLSGPSQATQITYLPNVYYNHRTDTYEGPWLRSIRGVGALSFDGVLLFDVPEVVSATEVLTSTVGQPTPVDFAVVLAGPMGDTGEFPQMRLDLSPIGLTSELPLRHEGGGKYLANTTITPSQSGRYALPVSLETREGGNWYGLLAVALEVYPDTDLSIYGDALGDGWTVTSRRGEPELMSSAFVHTGSFSHAISLPASSMVTYSFDDPDGLDLFGYTHLEFYINGGEGLQHARIIVGSGKAIPATVLSDLGIEVQPDTWTLVSIPIFSGDPMKSIYITGGAKDTFYIDDMKLVAAEMPTAVDEVSEGATAPEGYALSQNYPNPFNPTTTITYYLPEASHVRLDIYSITGQQVATLVYKHQRAGHYRISWDGAGFANGVYVYRLQAGQLQKARRMILLK